MVSVQQPHTGPFVQRGRGSGGRAARRAARLARTTGLAVKPGLEGGAYRPLSERDMDRIHDTALAVLERIGVGDPIPEILEHVLPAGGFLGEDGRLKLPRGLVEDCLARAPGHVVQHAPDPDLDVELCGSRVYSTTSGEAVRILDHATRSFRPSRLPDIFDAARLVDQLEHVHMFGQPFIASELSHDPYVHDLNVAYASLAGTRKPFGVSTATASHVDAMVELFDTFLGREGAFVERPFCGIGGCPIVSPLRFGRENAEVMVRCAELGLPYSMSVAAQAGATAPAALAGAMVQTFAETLACQVIMQLIRPDCIMHFGMWPFISDLRTGAFTGGSGEEAVISAASAQLGQRYGLLVGIPTGMTDSKLMDAQAGYEKGITTLTGALAGPNFLCAYPGALASLIGTSFEGMVIDNDMLGCVFRVLRGIEVTDETLSFEEIESAVSGAGHFLNQPQTLELMQTEYLYPEVADRRTFGEWEDGGKQDIAQLAHEKLVQLLSSHYPGYIDSKADARIRDRFPIELAARDMKPGNGRWDD